MKPKDCNDGNLAEAVFEFARETHELHLELKRSNDNNAVLCRIAEMENRILMTQTELEKALNNQTTQIGKIAKEQSDRFDVLTETIRLLNEQIAQGGAVTEGVVTAQTNVQAALDNMDAAIPDAPVPPTPA